MKAMVIEDVIWKEPFATKIETKHEVSLEEVEEALEARPHTVRAERGTVPGEDLYIAYGRTRDGRYLIIVFIDKGKRTALPISARDMTRRERRYHAKKAKR